MQSETSRPSNIRAFSIEDEGDAAQLYLFIDGVQVGGAYFPDDGTGASMELAADVGRLFAGLGRVLH